MWFQNLVPAMEKEVTDHGSEGLEALVEPVLLMVSESTRDEFQTHLQPFLRHLFPLTKSFHVSPCPRHTITHLHLFLLLHPLSSIVSSSDGSALAKFGNLSRKDSPQ